MQRREVTPPLPPIKNVCLQIFVSVVRWVSIFLTNFGFHLAFKCFFLGAVKMYDILDFSVEEKLFLHFHNQLAWIVFVFVLLPAIISNSMSRASCSSNCWSTSIPSLTLSLSNASFSCCLRMSISLRSALSPSWAVRMTDCLKYEKMLMKMHKVNNN